MPYDGNLPALLGSGSVARRTSREIARITGTTSIQAAQAQASAALGCLQLELANQGTLLRISHAERVTDLAEQALRRNPRIAPMLVNVLQDDMNKSSQIFNRGF